MLFMPADPLNSGGKSQGWFLDVLGIHEDGRGRVELFALPTGKFLNAIYGVLLDNFWELFPYGPGLRHHDILPMRGLVAWLKASKSMIHCAVLVVLIPKVFTDGSSHRMIYSG